MATEPETLRIRLEIDKFSEFARTRGQQRTSSPVVFRQLAWNFKVVNCAHYLQCCVQCNGNGSAPDWNCVALVSAGLPGKFNGWQVKTTEQEHAFDAKNSECELVLVYGMTQMVWGTNRFVNKQNDTLVAEALIIPRVVNVRNLARPRASLGDRMLYLLTSGKDANVKFLVGTEDGKKEQFAAHKGILSTISDVFDRMFDFDSIHGNADNVIEVTDVSPDAFRVMLNFIYTSNLAGLNQENVFDVLHAAKKYDIVDLVDACADCPKLDVNNVLYALGKALLYEVKKFVDKNACDVLKNGKFVEIDQALLCDFFARDQLVLHNGEMDLWNAALRWSKAQCLKCQVEYTIENCRKLLGAALFKIRFPLIPKNQFASIIVPTQVLTKDEMFSVLLYHVHPAKGIPRQYPLVFSSKVRTSSSNLHPTNNISNAWGASSSGW